MSTQIRRGVGLAAAAALAFCATVPLLKRGFTDLGPYSVDVMPYVMLRFLANPAVSIYACVYEHAKAGVWLDLVSRYDDGSGATFTTMRPTGLDPNPRETVVHARGSSSDMLYGRMLVERPQRPLMRLDAAEVIRWSAPAATIEAPADTDVILACVRYEQLSALRAKLGASWE